MSTIPFLCCWPTHFFYQTEISHLTIHYTPVLLLHITSVSVIPFFIAFLPLHEDILLRWLSSKNLNHLLHLVCKHRFASFHSQESHSQHHVWREEERLRKCFERSSYQQLETRGVSVTHLNKCCLEVFILNVYFIKQLEDSFWSCALLLSVKVEANRLKHCN